MIVNGVDDSRVTLSTSGPTVPGTRRREIPDRNDGEENRVRRD